MGADRLPRQPIFFFSSTLKSRDYPDPPPPFSLGLTLPLGPSPPVDDNSEANTQPVVSPRLNYLTIFSPAALSCAADPPVTRGCKRKNLLRLNRERTFPTIRERITRRASRLPFSLPRWIRSLRFRPPTIDLLCVSARLGSAPDFFSTSLFPVSLYVYFWLQLLLDLAGVSLDWPTHAPLPPTMVVCSAPSFLTLIAILEIGLGQRSPFSHRLQFVSP